MQQVLRPYATTGVAIVGAGLIAITPAATKPPIVHAMPEVTYSDNRIPYSKDPDLVERTRYACRTSCYPMPYHMTEFCTFGSCLTVTLI